jgi:hypothetical protein
MSTRYWGLALVLLGAGAAHAQEPDETVPPAEPPPTTEPAPDGVMPPADVQDPSTTSAEGGGEVELSASELEALGLSSGTTDAPAVDTALKLYGFMDFNITGVVNKRDSIWRGAAGRRPSFYFGSFNLYLSKNLSETIRTFAEVRFSYMPAGTRVANSPTGEVILTNADDYADFGRTAKWGGIEIERVYLEWAMHRYLMLRVGSFLTPYGVWNVDHGSPTIISFNRPYAIGLQLFPERQTGFELLGKYQVGASHSIGYHLTLSNGVGPLSEFKDLDGNKAVGGRLYWDTDAFGDLRIGGSIYYGRDTAANEVPGLGAGGKIAYTQNVTQQYDSLGLAADLTWKYKGLHLQSELITQQRKYTDAGRVGSTSPLVGKFMAPKDVTSWSVYGLAGYRFEWLGVMPYIVIQKTVYTDVGNQSNFDTLGVSTGLNIRPLEFVVIKLEYANAQFEQFYVTSDPIHLLQSQLAWAF